MKIKHFFAFAVAALVMASCGKDSGADGGGGGSGEQVRVTFELTNQPDNGRAGTRATEIGETDERKITKLEFWAFDGGTLEKYYTVATTGNTASFTIAAGTYDFYVVANQSIGTQPTEDDLLEQLATLEFSATNSQAVPTAGFPMVGSALTQNLSASVATHNIPVSMKRRVAKFNAPTTASPVTVTVDGTGWDDVFPTVDYETYGNTVTFALTGYVVANGLDKSDLYPQTPWLIGTKQYLNSTFSSGVYASVYAGSGSGDFFLDPNAATKPIVYTYENYPSDSETIGGETGYDRLKVYAMIIKGTLTADTETVTRYWRLNLVPGSEYAIEGNKVYKLNITDVTTLGYGTPEEAETEPNKPPVIPPAGETSVIFTLDVLEWDIFEENVILG